MSYLPETDTQNIKPEPLVVYVLTFKSLLDCMVWAGGSLHIYSVCIACISK